MIKTLRWKFVVINMTIVTLMLCIIFSLVYHFTCMDLENKSIAMMSRVADNPTKPGNPTELDQGVRLPYFTVELGRHTEILSTTGGYYDLSNQQFLQRLAQTALHANTSVGVLEEYGLRYSRVLSPSRQLLVFADISSEQATLSHLLRTCVFIGVISFAVFLGISILLARWAVRPVERAWREQKRFVADASHELKTPLTIITTNAELLQHTGLDEVSRMRFTGNVVHMAQHMRTLLEQMLELAQGDHQQDEAQWELVDLGALVSAQTLSHEAVFFEQGLSLECQGQTHMTLRGNPVALRQIVNILLDNARKYSSPKGKTVVTLHCAKRHRGLLTVCNPGPEIPPEDLPHLFQRFYRGDSVRSRTGSFGLGLAIAHSIVLRHRGRMWADSRQGHNTFCVELPILPSHRPNSTLTPPTKCAEER